MRAYFGRRLEAINIVEAVAALSMADARRLMRGGRFTVFERGLRDAAMFALREECSFNTAALAMWFNVSKDTAKVSLQRAAYTPWCRKHAYTAIGYLRGRLDEQEDIRRTAESIRKKRGTP